ncbi:ATP12 family chaperone protein [Pontixanthobacter gangjinensis]|uniref:Molecular chaperone n=1 Tax=Pontixanthobacter gangjinensis TaxID=1028742 RepID=A0A6I4SMK5_9SPHN|nr:ATP12 family protein [Pontixanthobacter gangjinensis]MXO56350.1 molecular chaperone [Pontixanthobacter gangjinensis]
MKRFYKDTGIAEAEGGFQVQLDGRPVKTALGSAQIAPTRSLAETLAAEWDAQGDKIDPALFRFRDHVDYTIDMVRPDRADPIAKLLKYAETDTLCYRADPGGHFFARQQEVWDPLLNEFEAREGVMMQRVSGIIHRPQSPEIATQLSNRLSALDEFALTSLLTMTSLTASLCIGMSALEAGADAEALWGAANLEEDWQIEQWGADYEAQAVRNRRTADFMTAWEFYTLTR